ncbi:MAG: EFR1 family ferrodoxin [Candidatus Lernaella stagnicola]|nr:EFR1 family ferrodoxin [Candidatus Lernaella stagnicola]
MNRRRFLTVMTATTIAARCGLGKARADNPGSRPPQAAQPIEVKKAAVVWYSQTGHTERMGRLIAKTLEKENIAVTAGACREMQIEALAEADLIVLGSPIFYVDVPEGMQRFLQKLPPLAGKAGAGFVTYGGIGHNVQNTAVRLLHAMRERGAMPVGHTAFGNMSAFAPTWSFGNDKRTLQYRHLPNEDTYEQAREFARQIVLAARNGQEDTSETKFSIEDMSRSFNLRWWTKLGINHHTINPETCIQCGACEATCPVGAIHLQARQIDHDQCILCLGCVNNCPTGALEMEMLNTRLLGFRRFCEQRGVKVVPPPELADAPTG